jgi:hypothetical protein
MGRELPGGGTGEYMGRELPGGGTGEYEFIHDMPTFPTGVMVLRFLLSFLTATMQSTPYWYEL